MTVHYKNDHLIKKDTGVQSVFGIFFFEKNHENGFLYLSSIGMASGIEKNNSIWNKIPYGI
jgi:hypothetical protein